MPRFVNVKEESGLTVQVSADLARGTFKAPQITATRSYTKENVAGIKNLTATFTASTDMKSFKTSHSAGLTYKKDVGKNIDIQLGAEWDLDEGEVVIPLTFTDNSTGISAGLEIKATLNLRELRENGVNLFLNLPMFGGNVTIKYNPMTQAVVVQVATSLDFPKGKPDDEPEAATCCMMIDYNQGLKVERVVEAIVHKRRRSPIRHELTHHNYNYNTNTERQYETRTNNNGGFWNWVSGLFEQKETNERVVYN